MVAQQRITMQLSPATQSGLRIYVAANAQSLVHLWCAPSERRLVHRTIPVRRDMQSIPRSKKRRPKNVSARVRCPDPECGKTYAGKSGLWYHLNHQRRCRGHLFKYKAK